MLRNYIKIALRNLWRQKLYAGINILGLATGISCCLFIMLYVWYEHSYDLFHEKSDRIYRLAVQYQLPGRTFDNSLSSPPMATALLNDYPEDVVTAVRFHHSGSNQLVSHGTDKQFYEDRFSYADTSVFSVFTFPLLKGNPKTALTEPYSVVITERIAQKYFGTEDPIGKALTLDHEYIYTVTGVMENLPANSHMAFDFLASFASLEAIMGDQLERWTFNPFYTYVLLPPDSDVQSFNAKLAAMIDNHIGEQLDTRNWKLKAFLQPLSKVHLHPLENDYASQGDIRNLHGFSVIALLILLIACINFMNLSTARTAKRAKEIGMRKALGAYRSQLARQFLSESLLTTGFAMFVAVLLVVLLLPVFSVVSGKPLSINHISIPVLTLVLIGITLLVGLISGSYGAFFLTAFRPTEILKAGSSIKPGQPSLRKALVVFQFSISIILLIGTLVVYGQLQYMRNMKLGFDKEQVVVVPARDSLVLARQKTIKGELLQNTSFVSVALTSIRPGRGAGGTLAQRPDSPERPPEIKVMMADGNLVETLRIEMAAGRYFSTDLATDVDQSLVLNETAVRSFGWSTPEEAIGQSLQYYGGGAEMTDKIVVGVARDFNFQPLRYGMQPLMLLLAPDACNYFLVRIAPGNVQESIIYLQDVWSRAVPEWPFEYSFLDEELDTLYQSEQRLGQLFTYFSGLGILIACLGLFGLAAFTAETRIKEISVRKVLGATVSGIVSMLSKDFARLVLISTVIAVPIGYYIMSRWLEDFAYRIGISWWVFVLAGGLALCIALLTVSTQAIKAALANPVESLRSE